MNLSWLLAATLEGWAPPAILDAHEAERKPITEQVSRFAMNHAIALQKERQAVPSDIEQAGPEGDKLRELTGRTLYELNVQQYACAGLNFGYYYDASPIVAYDGEAAPAYGMRDFTPSTVPGCRTPHLWLADGRSLYDVMGDGYTLLRRDPSVPVQALLDAAAARGMPLKLVELSGVDVASLYQQALVLSRPDQHVAWRGNALPENPLQLVDQLRGALREAVPA